MNNLKIFTEVDSGYCTSWIVEFLIRQNCTTRVPAEIIVFSNKIFRQRHKNCVFNKKIRFSAFH